ncbi:MAG: putative beta-lysine N-acetyltransferase [Deltaproteobacteria bacterium]|nr:putative beta-lysine N-acetyltransferase [Deltaproteobacteria bacterium]
MPRLVVDSDPVFASGNTHARRHAARRNGTPRPVASSSFSAKTLHSDIAPQQQAASTSLSNVRLTLDEGQVVEAFGVVFGVSHEVRGDGFSATLLLDQQNRRVRILAYTAADYAALILKVRWIAEANGFDKIIATATVSDWQEFLRFGYVLEAVATGFHRGADAFIVSKFRSQVRLASPSLMDEILLIERLMAEVAVGQPRPVPAGCRVRLAVPADIPQLVALYQRVFATYPSPLLHVSYLEHIFADENLFAVCERDGQVIAAASAELHPGALAAELTDCATAPPERGKGLMSHLLLLLEDELRQRGYLCAYTLARAPSFGMNAVFRRLGYAFGGRLVNNCTICGTFEDMNCWTKRLEPVVAALAAGAP